MTTTLFSDLSDEVQLHTESVPRATIEQFVRRACIQLARQSRVWKLHGTEVLVPGEDDYSIEHWINDPGQTSKQLIGIEEIRYDGKPLRRYTEKQLRDVTRRFTKVCGFYQETLHNITLLNVPAAFYENPDSIDWVISVAPSETATGMDTDLMMRYRDGIVYGAIGMLFSMPRKTWSSPEFASQYLGYFAGAIRDASTDAKQEFSRRVPRTVKYGGL